MDELEFSEAEANMSDLISEYTQYSQVGIDDDDFAEGGEESYGADVPAGDDGYGAVAPEGEEYGDEQ